jgi:hypothetical protein
MWRDAYGIAKLLPRTKSRWGRRVRANLFNAFGSHFVFDLLWKDFTTKLRLWTGTYIGTNLGMALAL